MKNDFKCPRCGNHNPDMIGYFHGIPYCRACISFQGKQANSNYQISRKPKLVLNYPLSSKQKEISIQVLESIKHKKNVLIYAVTGAGKTELVYDSMLFVLNEGGHVGFATPRKDVVIDLFPRIQEAFPVSKVFAVYGGHNEILEGDIIVLTTHQLYHYQGYFDLLILDEIDAFPYKDNAVLKSFFYQSVIGNYILLSATPSENDIQEIKKNNGVLFELNERYHHSPLPEPTIVECGRWIMFFYCYRYLHLFIKNRKPTFVFVPTIEVGKKLFSFLRNIVPSGAFVSSKEEERRLIIEKFKHGEFSYLVTTSILERGVTVKNLQVIVYEADHALYDSASLIQIAGRVGRKLGATTGSVIFLCYETNEEIEKARALIHGHNRKANLL